MLEKYLKYFKLSFVILVFAFSSCATKKVEQGGKFDQMYYITSWQLSAEGQAVIIQAFNAAKARIKSIVEMAKDPKNSEWSYKEINGVKKLYHYEMPAAIISDIDDTLVNGVNYTANIIGASGDWNNAAFARFVLSDNCTALPMSVDFVKYCFDNGIDFYYLTNRYDQGYKIGQKDSVSSYTESIKRDGKGHYIKNGKEIGSSIYQVFGKSFYDITFESMKKLGFPVSDQNLLVNDSKLNGSSKEKYRNLIKNGCTNYPNGVRIDENANNLNPYFSASKHDIIMLLGDQSTDFTDLLTPSSTMDAVERAEKSLDYSDKWGVEWIMLPNGVYGTSQEAAARFGYEKLFQYYSNATRK